MYQHIFIQNRIYFKTCKTLNNEIYKYEMFDVGACLLIRWVLAQGRVIELPVFKTEIRYFRLTGKNILNKLIIISVNSYSFFSNYQSTFTVELRKMLPVNKTCREQ